MEECRVSYIIGEGGVVLNMAAVRDMVSQTLQEGFSYVNAIGPAMQPDGCLGLILIFRRTVLHFPPLAPVQIDEPRRIEGPRKTDFVNPYDE